jgi:L-malate glycosyltransferase
VHRVRLLFERFTLPRADAVICVTEHVAAYAARHGAVHREVIYNRVYTDQFRHAVASGSQRSARLKILSVGRLVAPKDQACLIRALLPLDAELVLIGEGENGPALRRLAAELGVGSRVSFVPSVPHSEIARWYADADLFAMATHYEGFCIPVLEAMAAGLPIVASDIPAIREIVGDAAVLVNTDPESFAREVRSLAEDPDRRVALGERARQRAAALSGDMMEARERAVYARLCGERSGAPS